MKVTFEEGPKTGLYEAPYINIYHKESNFYSILIRNTILSSIPKPYLSFDLANFDSTDSHIGFNDLEIQFRQICIGDGLSNLSFYVENKTDKYIPYKTSHLLMNGKPFDLAKYNINDYVLGYVNVGCYVEIKKIEVKEHTMFSKAYAFKWYEDGQHMRFRCDDKDIVNKALDFIIQTYKSYLGNHHLIDDEGPYGNLISNEALKKDCRIQCSRYTYTKEKYTSLTKTEQVDDIIKMLIQKFEGMKK